MADPHDIDHYQGSPGDYGSTVGAPRWVKTMVIIVVAVVMAAVVVMLLVGGHRPGQHGWSGSTTDRSATVFPLPEDE